MVNLGCILLGTYLDKVHHHQPNSVCTNRKGLSGKGSQLPNISEHQAQTNANFEMASSTNSGAVLPVVVQLAPFL